MYQAIVFLPLIGAILAGIISLYGARKRFPGAGASDDHHAAPSHGHSTRRLPAITPSFMRATTNTRRPSPPPKARAPPRSSPPRSCSSPWCSPGSRSGGSALATPTSVCRCSTGSCRATSRSHGRCISNALTAVMLVVVATVSALVHLYSLGYMAEDPYRPRFFAYLLSSFHLRDARARHLQQPRAAVLRPEEGVGLASYLLIGFWYYKPEANAATIKAFVVNRVGDFGFALGIFAAFHDGRLDRGSTRCSRRPRR